MNINQIKDSKEILRPDYNSFKSFVNQHPEFKKGATESEIKYKGLNLNFWYYYDSKLKHIGAYKNGIWIRLTNHSLLNGSLIWLFVLIDKSKKKKISIFSDKKLASVPKLKSVSYTLPFFQNREVFFPTKRVGNVFNEDNEVKDISDEMLFTEFINKLNHFISNNG